MSIQIKTAAVTGPKTCEILELTTPDLGRGEDRGCLSYPDTPGPGRLCP